MRSRALAHWSAILVLILAGCDLVASTPPATPTPTLVPVSTPTAAPSLGPSNAATSDCGIVVATSEPAGTSAKPLAVFSSADGVWLYDIRADSVKVLDPTASGWGPGPRFRTPALVSLVRLREPADESHTFGQDSLYELDLERGSVQEMLRLPNDLLAFEWSPDGTVLAYLVAAETEDRLLPSRLCLFDTRSGLTTAIRSLSYTIGRGGNQRDERSIAWSPDGTTLLVLDTVQDPSMYVVDLDGRDVVPPRQGTFARWLSADRVLFAEGNPSGGVFETWSWLTVSTATGRTDSFGLPDAAFRPALSPGGDRIAFDDGAKEPSVYVFDIAQGTTHRLAGGYVGLVWLGPDLIAATAAGPRSADDLLDIPWSALGTTMGFDLVAGEDRPLALPATQNDGGFSGAIDVLLPIFRVLISPSAKV